MHTHTVTGRRLHPDFGLEVAGLDLRNTLSEYLWEGLRQALRTHALLAFCGQALPAADLVKVARQFGASQSDVKRYARTGPLPDQQWHAGPAPTVAILMSVREAPAGAGFELMRAGAERSFRYGLSAGDILLWDNVALVHRSCALAGGERRIVEEIAIS